jgi:hypothetical protein
MAESSGEDARIDFGRGYPQPDRLVLYQCRTPGIQVDRANPKETAMLAICIHLAAAIRRYLAFYMPTNRAVDWLRSPRGMRWAIPVAILATPTYLFAMSVCMTLIERGSPGYLNVMVMLFAWNALKAAATAALSPVLLLRRVLGGRTSSAAPRAGLGAGHA